MSDKNLLERHNFKMQKKYGQNFLTDVRIPIRIAENCTDFDVSEGKTAESLMLEIGPGAGILTKELARRFTRVVAVEIDNELIPVLEDSLDGFENITVINEDVMKVDLTKTLAPFREYGGGILPVSVCANLPYYITTPVIMKLLEEYDSFSFITVMVQKEVARRLCSKPGDTDYGAITAAVNLYGKVTKLFDVSAGNFNPRPKVDSSVIKISLYPKAKYSPDEIKKASRVIKAAFSMRRKTLVNTLSEFGTKEYLTDVITELFGKPTVRGEELSTEEFVSLSKKLIP